MGCSLKRSTSRAIVLKTDYIISFLDKADFISEISASDIIKDHHANNTASLTSSDHHLPLKKQKLEEYFHSLGKVPPYGLPTTVSASSSGIVPPLPANIQQIYASLEPVYIQRCLQEFNSVNRHLSAFKPVVQTIREQKLRSANALGLATKCAADPPLLQNPERVVPMSESERFESSYQPNVALAPPTLKKLRYGRAHEILTVTNSQQCSPNCSSVKSGAYSPNKAEPPPPLTNGHVELEQVEVEAARTPSEGSVDSTVSVVQITNNHNTVLVQNNTNKYNPEIELSTDTEDSASETSERNPELLKLEEFLKGVDVDVRDKVFDLFKKLSKERERAVVDSRTKEDRISELELKNSELLKELGELRTKNNFNNNNNNHKPVDSPRDNEIVTSSSIIQSTEDSKVLSTDPIQVTSPKVLIETQQKSVIASVAAINDQKDILSTAPE